MLREPRAHVLSQYAECESSSDWPASHVAENNLPSFQEWVQAWAERAANATDSEPEKFSYWEDDFGCYRPVDFQTQRMTCKDSSFNYSDMDVAGAIQHMQKTDYVGIVEKYQESICLFHTKMFGILPDYCDCTNQNAWSSFNPTTEDHDVKPHNISDYPESVFKQVDYITQKDKRLYEAALQRLRKELQDVEGRFGIKVLCE